MSKENSDLTYNKTSCDSSTKKGTSLNLKSHWDTIYKKNIINKLGWYEENPQPSLQLIEKCNLNKDAKILHVGAGATTLVDELIKLGYKNIIASDLSSYALEKLKERLREQSSKVKWIVEDITNSKKLNQLEKIDLWHDRAVLHFLLCKEDQDAYFNLLKQLVNKNAHVIIATFNLNGATKCSGLQVHRYNKNMLQEKLGSTFKLIKAFDDTYTMPSGSTREFIYTLFKKY